MVEVGGFFLDFLVSLPDQFLQAFGIVDGL